jgi:hypothetical protein
MTTTATHNSPDTTPARVLFCVPYDDRTIMHRPHTTPRGVVGWRLCPAKLDRQPAFLAWALLAQRTAAAAPHAQSVYMRCVHTTTRIC